MDIESIKITGKDIKTCLSYQEILQKDGVYIGSSYGWKNSMWRIVVVNKTAYLVNRHGDIADLSDFYKKEYYVVTNEDYEVKYKLYTFDDVKLNPGSYVSDDWDRDDTFKTGYWVLTSKDGKVFWARATTPNLEYSSFNKYPEYYYKYSYRKIS